MAVQWKWRFPDRWRTLMTRLKLRAFLLSIAILTFVVWHAAKVTNWVLRRPAYAVLESYHRGKAEGAHHLWISMRHAHRLAENWMVNLLVNPEIDVRKAKIEEYFQYFHPVLGPQADMCPFSGPRSGWMDVMEAHQAEIDHLAEEVAEHEWLAKWYKRAYTTPWCEPPTEAIDRLERKWLEARVPWWTRICSPRGTGR